MFLFSCLIAPDPAFAEVSGNLATDFKRSSIGPLKPSNTNKAFPPHLNPQIKLVAAASFFPSPHSSFPCFSFQNVLGQIHSQCNTIQVDAGTSGMDLVCFIKRN